MFKQLVIKENFYKDSIVLMAITNKVNQLPEVHQSSIGMATEMNKEIIREIGFTDPNLEMVKESDMLVALVVEDEAAITTVLEALDSFLEAKSDDDASVKEYSTTKQAIEELAPNLAVVSIPGAQAYREVKRCLDNDVNVMLFSDNMSIEEERKLKEYAAAKDLLVMGPDCGTAIINGVGLCFANKVRRGNIGIVGASGTGIQETTVLIHQFGGGISHAIGTGGRDLSKEVGGIMMLKGMDLLEQDPETKVILLISKPPAPEVAQKVLEKVRKSAKKYIVCFINGENEEPAITFAVTLESAAVLATEASLNKEITIEAETEKIIAQQEIQRVAQGAGKYLRALYCGGTLAAETEMIVERAFSNVTKKAEKKLKNAFVSQQHTIVDLGDDAFTQGKPHPMIDPSIRNQRIIEEGNDLETAVLLLDFELGFGSNDNPVGLTIPAIEKVMEQAKVLNRPLTIIAYVMASDNEKQDTKEQLELLKAQGIILAKTNAQAARIAKEIIDGLEVEK